MKFICSGIDLKEATGKLKSVVSGASPDDILNGIKVVASKGVVSFTASDREMTVDKRLGADVKVEGSTVVEGRFFCDLCSLIGDMQVHIVVSDNTMTIKYGDNVVEATCFDSNDYPISRVFDKTSEFEIVSSELCDLVDKIEFCASIDNARPILRGICMEIDDKVVTGVALDGYRLAKMSKKLEKSTIKNTSFVVPAKALKEAVRSIGSTLDVVKILVDKSAILIDAEHIKITIVLLEGEYLNHRQFIPTSFSSTAVVPKEQLKTSIGRVKLITQNEKANALAMEFLPATVVLSSKSERGTITEKVLSKLDGVEIKIGFNAKFVTDALSAIDTESIAVKLNNPSAPVLFLPSGGEEGALYLILPLRLVG